MLNAVIAGNIGENAKTRQAGNSTVASFSVAVEQRGREGKVTTWVNCSMWGKRGETLVPYLSKGSKVCASGELTTREYNGKTYLELNVSDVTLMGGTKRDGNASSQQSQPGGNAYGATTGGLPDMDDAIPFAAEVRA